MPWWCAVCGVEGGSVGCRHEQQQHRTIQAAKKSAVHKEMSAVREVELTSPSECTFDAGKVRVSSEEPWTIAKHGEEDGTSVFPCAMLQEGTTIRIGPMDREYGGWDDVHFHSSLRLPMQCSIGQGMVVTLEAMARECVTVALSPGPSFALGKTYVVHFGAAGNVSTVIRRRLPSGTEAVDVTLPSRVCLERDWVSYWVALVGGIVYVGVGKIPGKQCIGILDDSLYHQLRSPIDAVKFVGLGNSALGRNARPLKMRNVCITTVPPYLPEALNASPTDTLPFISVESEQDAEETKKLLEEYQEECRKARARAQKFGIAYKEPSHQAFLQWSQARRLRANPEKGFITGMDITSPQELAKQEARKARFGTAKRDRDEELENENEAGNEMMEEEAEPLSVIQAWDNEELVRPHRTDQPASLWVTPPPKEEQEAENDFVMTTPDPIPVAEKIHMCSIDWAAFKQIRTDDIMAYFSSYGPSYVEWLGELSCNVLFEDKFSASRALHHLSQELPSPPPPEISSSALSEAGDEEEMKDNDEKPPTPDLGNMGWRFCQHPIKKVTNDRYGRRGTTARMLMRVATSLDVLVERPSHWPAPPPGFTTKRVLGPGSDFDTREPRRKKRRKNNPRNEDFGSNGEPDLDRGLRSGRDGFSVEELEAERAAKRAALDEQAPERVEGADVETRDGVED